VCDCVCAGGQQLAVSDADTAPDELEFELVEAPIHGELIKTDDSTNTHMTNGKMILSIVISNELNVIANYTN